MGREVEKFLGRLMLAAVLAIIAAAIYCAFFLKPAFAEGARVELSAGATRYGSVDGLWYDSFHPCELNTSPSSQILSVAVPGWRYSLVHLGEASVRAIWAHGERVDELRAGHAFAPKYIGVGSGDVLGVSVGKTAAARLGELALRAEGGLFLYQGQWHERVVLLHGGGLALVDDTAHLNLTGFAGLTVRYGMFFAEARAYYAIKDGFINRGARQLTIGLSAPF